MRTRATERTRPLRVLDPFVGSGTVALAAEDAGAVGHGVEAHPFMFRVARAKTLRRTDPDAFASLARRILQSAQSRKPHTEHYPDLLHRCYAPESLARLDTLRAAVEAARDDSPAWELVWLALVAALRPSASANTAQWQYVLPSKTKARVVDPHEAFTTNVEAFRADMLAIGPRTSEPATVELGDARRLDSISAESVDLIITSPPYPNNYDYADATRLEMCFLGEIRGWGDLQESVRKHLVRACTQHVPESAVDLDSVMASEELAPLHPDIASVVQRLAEVRGERGGKKTYHLMIACYYFDMALTWRALRRVCASGSEACFVIGDSAPYGIHAPAPEWMRRLAEAAGFTFLRFEKIRDRNVKWKNRKHRVPLCEGRLWMKG